MRKGGSVLLAKASLAVLLIATACTSGGDVQRALRGNEAVAGRGEREVIRAHPENIMEDLNGYVEWFYGQRAAPTKRIPAGMRQAALRQARSIEARSRTIAAGRSIAVASASWQSIGPEPLDASDPRFQDPFGSNYGAGWGVNSGRLTDVEVHPTDPDIVYAGAADGGVWKSTDGGGTFTPIFDDQPSLAVGDMDLAPSRPRVLYVGTGESGTSQDAYYGAGVFKSTNAGASFTKVGGTLFDRKTVFRIWATSSGSTVYVATNKGLYRTNNGGGSWSLILAPGNPELFESFVTDVVVMPGSESQQLVAAVGWRGGKATNGLYWSRNRGNSWTFLGSPPGFAEQSRIGRTSLAVTTDDRRLMYAVVQDAQCFNVGGCFEGTVLNGIYRSTRGVGGPWTKVADSESLAARPSTAMDPDKIGHGFGPGVQAWYNQYVEIDPTDEDNVIVGLEEVWNSPDGGDTWDAIGRYWNFCYANPPWPESPWCNADPHAMPTTHPDQHGAAFSIERRRGGDDDDDDDGGGTAVLFVAGDGGLWRQTGPGFDNDSWNNLNDSGLSTVQFYYAESSSDGTVYGGTQDNGTLKYEGNPTWPEPFGGDGGDIIVHPDNADLVVEEYVFMLISRSQNGGVTWTQIPPDDPFPRFIAPFHMDPTDTNRWVAAGQQIWVSTQGWATTSSSWQSKYDFTFPRQSTAVDIYDGTVYSAWCGPCNPSDFTGPGTFQAGLATNAGAADPDDPAGYHAVAGNGLPNRYITSVAIDPTNEQHVYATVSGFARRWIPSTGHGSVFESTDGGQNFTDISANLPNGPANDVILYNGRVIVGTDVGVFERMPGGQWAVLGTGLPLGVSSLDLFLVPNSSTLGVATHGRGAWLLALD